MRNNNSNLNYWCRLAAAGAIMAVIAAPGAHAGGKCGDTDECLHTMRDSIAKRGWLGIEYEDHDGEGLPEIVRVLEDGPAAEGGMRPGDRLVSINGVSYDSPREEIYAEVKKSLRPGNSVRFQVRRGDELVNLTVIAGQVPEHIAAQWIGRHMLEYHVADEDAAVEQEQGQDQEG